MPSTGFGNPHRYPDAPQVTTAEGGQRERPRDTVPSVVVFALLPLTDLQATRTEI